MPRKPRYIEPGTTYHIISRFVDREWFIKKAYERKHYLKLLGISLEQTDWRLHAYAIMSNHIHLEATAGQQSLGEWIRCVHSPFATAMNRAYDRIGPMFVRGPRAYPVAPEAFGSLMAYIHNNPVRAGVCNVATQSNWTSHRAYVGEAEAPAWLDVAGGMRRAGFADPRALDAWIRDPARREGEVQFTEQHYESADCEARDRVAARNTAHAQVTAERVVDAVTEILGVSLGQLRGTSRGASEVLGREVAVRCATSAGISGRAIAGLLNLSEARVSVLRQMPQQARVRALCDEVRCHVGARARLPEGASLSEGV